MNAGFAAIALLGATVACAAAERTVLFFGDSLTAGYGLDDPGTQAYPARIEQKIEAEHLPWRAVNAGLSGETSAGGLRRVDWILRQPVGVFVLALGGNDGLRGIEPAVLKANLQSIIDRVHAKDPSIQVVIAGMEMPSNLGEGYTKAFHQVYADLAASNHLALIPFLLEGVGGISSLNQGDGMHPNPEGAKRVADNVWVVLGPMLERPRS
jgi:acyl-CoA thioesterase-1